MTSTLHLRDLYDSEMTARREGRTDAADALERRRLAIADAEALCAHCGAVTTSALKREVDEVRIHAFHCPHDGLVGTKVTGVAGSPASYAGDLTLVEYR